MEVKVISSSFDPYAKRVHMVLEFQPATSIEHDGIAPVLSPENCAVAVVAPAHLGNVLRLVLSIEAVFKAQQPMHGSESYAEMQKRVEGELGRQGGSGFSGRPAVSKPACCVCGATEKVAFWRTGEGQPEIVFCDVHNPNDTYWTEGLTDALKPAGDAGAQSGDVSQEGADAPKASSDANEAGKSDKSPAKTAGKSKVAKD